MTSLDLIGEQGSAALKRLLTTCNDPIEAITNFQTNNAIKCPTLSPALKLLDLHNVRRSEFHDIVANDLRERLIVKIRELANGTTSTDSTMATCKNESNSLAKVNELVIKGFPFVNIPHLRPVVLEALKQLPKLPDFYLNRVKNDSTLYEDAAVEVKQQIWIEDEKLFLKELTPVFHLYLESKRTYFLDIDSCFPNYYAESSKLRRKNVHISTLCLMVGKSTVLYDRLLGHLRQFFLSSSNEHFCSLRSELLMALRDRDIQELLAVDSCHKFAWCLDACLKDKHLDPKHASELKSVLDSTAKKSKSEKDRYLLADLAMIVADPYVLHFLNQLISKLITSCINNESLPRDNTSFNLILRLLNLGVHAKEILEKYLSSSSISTLDSIDDIKEPKIDAIIYTKFLSSLMCLTCRDLFRIGKQNLVTDEGQDAFNSDEDILIQNQLPESIIEPFIISDPLCCRLIMYYILEMLKRRYLEVILSKAWFYLSRSHCGTGGPYSETFLHLLVYHLLSLAERLGSEDDAFDAVFGKFLLKKISVPCVKYQTAKLAFFCASKFPKIKRDYLLECFKTAKENVGDAEIVDQNSLEDTHTFERIFEAVENKFDDIDVHENEILAHGTPGTATTETLAPAHILNARSLSDDFPEVPTPMTPHF